MNELTVARCPMVRLVPDAGRVITKPFLPREEIFPDGSTRMQLVLQRLVAMPESDLAARYREIARNTAARLALRARNKAISFPKIVVQNT